MKTMHFITHVSREVAKLLKKAGFDWPSIGYYNKLGFFHNAIPQYGELKAPALDVAQKWLREVKNVRVCIDGLFLSKTSNRYVVRWTNFPCTVWKNTTEMFEYDTYEEAQEAGIRKALELILENGE